MKSIYPEYYKTVTICYQFPNYEEQKKSAWLSVNDSEEYIWTLSEDDITIIPDKYVTNWF